FDRATIINSVEASRGLLYLLLFLALHPFSDLRGHLTPDFLGRIFADVRNDNCDFTRLNLLRCFGDDFEQQRIDVVSAGQQDVFLWTTLAAIADELVSVLEVVMACERFGHVIARVKRSAIQRLDETDLVLVDHSRVEESYVEQTGFRFIAAFDRR